MVRAETKRELALEPHRLGALLLQALVIASERGAREIAQPPFGLALAEAAPAPARVEQAQHLAQRLSALGVIALEHLVHRDPEALVKRLGRGDAQDAGELVSQRAAAVG